MAKIVACKEDSKYLRIKVDYPKKVIYQPYYRVYETRKTAPTAGEWIEVEDGESNEILLSNLWQFKDYTIEIAIKNKYSNVFGKSRCQSGLKITSHNIRFDDSEDARLDEAQEFESYDHKSLYCQ